MVGCSGNIEGSFEIYDLDFKMKPANMTMIIPDSVAIQIQGCSRQRGWLTEIGTLQGRCDTETEINEANLFLRERI